MSAFQLQRSWVTARLRPERCRFSPSGKPIGATPQTPVYAAMLHYNSDNGFGNIAAASSHYAFFARHAYSARLRSYRYVILFPNKSSIFREPCPPRRLGRRVASATGRANGFKGKAFIKIDGFRYIKF